MRKVRLRPHALSDLAEIRRYTRATWGSDQANLYLDALEECLDVIAAGTAVTTTTFAVGQEFRRTRCREHLIYFLESAGSLEIVRILHPRMNLDEHLADER